MGHRIAHAILDKIDAIILSSEYNRLNGYLKTHFLKSRYFAEGPEVDSTKSYYENNMLIQNPDKEQKWQTWRKRYAHKVTGRNRLLSLYTHVSSH